MFNICTMLKYILSLAILLFTVLAYIIFQFKDVPYAELYLILMLIFDAGFIFLIIKKWNK